MNRVLYWLVRGFVAFLQALPLGAVARLGRAGGLLWWMLDFKHRPLVVRNLAQSFPERSRAEIRSITREVFQRIPENGFAAVKTASLSPDKLRNFCTLTGIEKLPRPGSPDAPLNCIGAIGHFGNFELYAMISKALTGWQGATTYRGMNQPGLDAVVQKLRERSGCWFFERRTEAKALKDALSKGGIFLGLLADQRPGKGGAEIPFLGRTCATTLAPAIFALRYDAPLFPVICHRLQIGRWQIDVGDEIPLASANGQPRSTIEIMTDVNRAFEAAVRRDPANWFWVHDRWKQRRRKSADVPATGPGKEFESPSS